MQMDTSTVDSEGKINLSVDEGKSRFDEFYELSQEDLEVLKKDLKEIKSLFGFLLSNIRQHFTSFPKYKDKIQRILFRIEDTVILIMNIDFKTMNERLMINLNSSLEKTLLIFLSILDIESIGYIELFSHFFHKLLKILKNTFTFSEKLKSYMTNFSYLFSKILNSITEKKIDCVDKYFDCKIILKLAKMPEVILEFIPEVLTEEVDVMKIFNFLMISRHNIFNLTNDVYLEESSKIIYKTCKILIKTSTNNSFVSSLTEILLNKMLEFSKNKDDLKSTLDQYHQVFIVNTLIMCIKIMIHVVDKYFDNQELQESILDRFTRIIIELSFWDNSLIVEYTCKLFLSFWKKIVRVNHTPARSSFEKVLDYFFIKRYYSYYENLTDNNEDCNIKLSVLEILTNYLNELIQSYNLVLICYSNFDFSKIRYNFTIELLNQIQKYFNLGDAKFSFLKKLLGITFLSITENILTITTNLKQNENVEVLKLDAAYLERYHDLTEQWEDIIKTLKLNKPKKLLEKANKILNIDPKDEEAYKKGLNKFAKSVAALIKNSYMVDIENLYEILGGKDDLSKEVLKEFSDTFNFRENDILKAYRTYVSTFKLGGESFNIGNMVGGYATKYYQDQLTDPNHIFKNEDDVYCFAYSIIMLNTDLHNPEVKDRMTLEGFLKNNASLKLPSEYLSNIYKSIANDPLMVALPKHYDFSKSEELFQVIKTKKTLHAIQCQEMVELETLDTYLPNMHLHYFNKGKLNNLNFPSIDCFENFNYIYNPEEENKNVYVKELVHLFWEDFFINFMTIPNKYFEAPEENMRRTIENICTISQTFGMKGNIDKLLLRIHQIIQSESTKKSNIFPLYNLFFKISIDFSKNYQSYLEIYFQSITSILKHKLDNKTRDLKLNYIRLFENIIEDTYSVLKDRIEAKSNNSSGFLYSFFGGGRSNEENTQINIDKFRIKVFKNIEILSYSEKNELINLSDSKEELIDFKRITDIIKNQEEEFIFFTTWASSKILNYNTKTEFYFSLIFLNEILDIDQHKFAKIWPNLLNIAKDKMDAKTLFDNDINIFDFLLVNNILCEVMAKFSSNIEADEYNQLLDLYLDVENMDLIYFILDNNNKFLKSFTKSSQLKKETIFVANLALIHNDIKYFATQLFDKSKNNKIHIRDSLFKKIFNLSNFFKNLLDVFDDFSILSIDSCNFLTCFLKTFQDFNFVEIFAVNNEISTLIQIINKLIVGLDNSLPKNDDEKWNIFVKLFEFNLKSMLYENFDSQKHFLGLLENMINIKSVPQVRYKEIISLINKFSAIFVTVKQKYKGYWVDMFKLLDLLIKNNEKVLDSPEDMELLIWHTFIKKLLISFVDYNKNSKVYTEEEYKPILNEIFKLINEKVKLANEKPSWWDSGKNLVKLYFPEFIMI